MEDVIDKAGRQRMLCERMVKSYVQIVSGIAPQAAAAELADAIGAFDNQLGDLKASAPQADAHAALGEERAWDRFRALNALPRARAAARLVNLSGRQRMLSQRIAKDHLLLMEDYGNGDVRQELTFACVDFGRALSDLRAASCNTGELRDELAGVAGAWRVLLELVRSDRRLHDKVLAGAEDILQRMERVTSLYERLAAGD